MPFIVYLQDQSNCHITLLYEMFAVHCLLLVFGKADLNAYTEKNPQTKTDLRKSKT